MRFRTLPDPDHLPALDWRFVQEHPAVGLGPEDHMPRILLLYGSLRPRSYSRLATEEAARLLHLFGAEIRIFDPSDMPFPDQIAGDDHPAIHELREHAMWSEGMVWCSPERHGQITGLMKAQIDNLPLNMGGMRPTQGRTLAVMQVSGGSQSFNAVNTLRLLGRWMRRSAPAAPGVIHGTRCACFRPRVTARFPAGRCRQARRKAFRHGTR
jgi:Predicted flavoprotein